MKMLASVGRPSLHGYDACMVYWVNAALRRNCRQKQDKTSFFPRKVFLFSRNSQKRFWGLILWYLWIGRAKHPGPGLLEVGLLMVTLHWRLKLIFWRLLSIG